MFERMSEGVQREIEELNEVASAFMKSQVLLVANQYDLFSKIDGQSLSAQKISDLLETDERATRMVLDALTGMNYLEKQNGTYQNSDVSKRLLVRHSPYYQGDSLRHRYRLWFNWSALRDVTATGLPPERPFAVYTESEEQRTHDFVRAMDNSGRIRAQKLVESLDVAGVTTLLDLGGGPGTYALAFAQKYPDVKAVVYDLPEVCPLTEEHIRKAGLSERVIARPGDFLEDELGSGYDLVFISNIIHSYSLDEVRRILRKSFEGLHPGGRIVVKDFFVNEDRTSPLFSLLFAINMLVNTKAGDAYTFREVESELTEVGFTGLRREKLTEQSWMILGKKERGGS